MASGVFPLVISKTTSDSGWAVKTMVNRAYATGDWSIAKGLFEAVNSA